MKRKYIAHRTIRNQKTQSTVASPFIPTSYLNIVATSVQYNLFKPETILNGRSGQSDIKIFYEHITMESIFGDLYAVYIAGVFNVIFKLYIVEWTFFWHGQACMVLF